jgi:hypothetical protein
LSYIQPSREEWVTRLWSKSDVHDGPEEHRDDDNSNYSINEISEKLKYLVHVR